MFLDEITCFLYALWADLKKIGVKSDNSLVWMQALLCLHMFVRA
jgi:hypothetical protein